MLISRFSRNPIITARLFEEAGVAEEGHNINGPSLVRVPAWVAAPLGRYYLYFGHHGGQSIRLAYADDVRGPYRLFQPRQGVLRLNKNRRIALARDIEICHHIASPDVHLDEENRRFVLYFHGPTRVNGVSIDQKSFAATSPDGLDFNGQIEPNVLGRSYFRVWQWCGRRYAFGNRGTLYRAPIEPTDAENAWEECPRNPLQRCLRDRDGETVEVRHCTVDLRGDTLTVYFTAVGHAPERILKTRISLTDDWHEWRATDVEEVLRPAMDYEGIEFPVQPSQTGSKIEARQLRDPCFFRDADGREYLIYAVAGEMALAGAELQSL